MEVSEAILHKYLEERDQLKAQNERLRNCVNEVFDLTEKIISNADKYADCEQVMQIGEIVWPLLNETPEQSLAAIKAEAVREAVRACSVDSVLIGPTNHRLFEYADKLETGEKVTVNEST